MGNFFTNMHIKKENNINITNIKEAFINMMISNGYELVDDEEKSDGKLTIFTTNNSKWITVYSDLLEFNNTEYFKKIYDSLKLATDFLGISCYDSDYVFMNLINDKDKTDAWVNIGHSSEIKCMRKTNFSEWKNKVNNIKKFKEDVKKKYIFAEDFLESTYEQFDLPSEQSQMQEGYSMEDKMNCTVFQLYFLCKDNTVINELPKLKIHLFSLTPCIPGQPQTIMACNKGGASRGIAVVIFGDFAKNDEIIFSETYFQYSNNNKYELRPIKFEKYQIQKDLWGYKWEDKDFYIPPKVNDNLSEIKKLQMECNRAFGIKFIPNGNNRKFLDINVCFIPLKNWENGQDTWYVWRDYRSKKQFLESENIRRMKSTRGTFPEDRLGIYNLKDYDL